MFKYSVLFLVFLNASSCAFKIQSGTYTTTDPENTSGISFVSENITLTENGRFSYSFSTDDGPGCRGIGGYVVLINWLILVFENSDVGESKILKKEVPCMKQDSQVIDFFVSNINKEPIIAATIYNPNHQNQGAFSNMQGLATLTLPKSDSTLVLKTNLIMHDQVEFEIDGNKCYFIDVILKDKTTILELGKTKFFKLKKEEGQLFMKNSNGKDYFKVYKKENRH